MPAKPSLNAHPLGRIRGRVRALLLLAFAAGCSARPAHMPAHQVVLGPPGTLAVSVDHALGWPYRTTRTLIALDGAIVPGGVTSVVEGVHTVSVLTDVTVPCSLFSDHRSLIRVRSSESFTVGDAPAAVQMHVFADPDASKPHDERIHVRWSLVGASLAGHGEIAMPAECAKLDPPRRVECHVSARLEAARKARDIISFNCQQDKLQRIQALLPDAATGNPVAIAAILRLERESEACIGEDLAYVAGPSITASDTCGPEITDGLTQAAPFEPHPFFLTPPSNLPPVK